MNTDKLNAAQKAWITRKHKEIDRKAAALKAWVTIRAIRGIKVA